MFEIIEKTWLGQKSKHNNIDASETVHERIFVIQ